MAKGKSEKSGKSTKKDKAPSKAPKKQALSDKDLAQVTGGSLNFTRQQTPVAQKGTPNPTTVNPGGINFNKG